MRTWISVLLFAAFAVCHAEKIFHKYDVAAVKRFEDELSRLGVKLTSVTKPDEPTTRPDPVVSSPAGEFEGYWTKTQFGRPIAAFEGIPYAKPIRFKVAEPVPRLEGFKAKKPGEVCIQRNIYMHSPYIEGKEDCLFINIYVPECVKRTERQQLPVMFWIHGGGFLSGSGSLYQPNILLDQDVVLVTFNYRLGPLGFMATEDGVIPGNLGLKDQVSALRWVQENIAAFGGNPNLITVFGQSAGGASSEFHMLSPLSRGLFHRAISISGSVFAPWALALPGEAQRHRNVAAEYLGCPTKPTTDLLACLTKKTAEEITGVDEAFIEWIISPIMPFKPVVEGDVPGAYLPFHPNKIYADGTINDVPWMFGMTAEEGGVGAVDVFTNATYLSDLNEKFNELVPMVLLLDKRIPAENMAAAFDLVRRVYFPPGPIKKTNVGDFINVVTDFLFLGPMYESDQVHRKVSTAPTYAWVFDFVGSRSFTLVFGDPSGDKYGTCHTDDLLFLFPLSMLGELKPEDVLMSIIWTDLYASFARDGAPSSKLLKTAWKPVAPKGTNIDYLHIQSPGKITMKENPYPERKTFLDVFYKSFETPLRDEL